jgi:hypothetical protein
LRRWAGRGKMKVLCLSQLPNTPSRHTSTHPNILLPPNDQHQALLRIHC